MSFSFLLHSSWHAGLLPAVVTPVVALVDPPAMAAMGLVLAFFSLRGDGVFDEGDSNSLFRRGLGDI
jgi:hypothetical protein